MECFCSDMIFKFGNQELGIHEVFVALIASTLTITVWNQCIAVTEQQKVWLSTAATYSVIALYHVYSKK